MGRRCCRHQRRPWRQFVSLQFVKEHSRADIHTAVQGRHQDTRDKRALKKAAAHREPMQEYIFCQELWALGDQCWSSPFLKDCMLWEEIKVDQVLKNSSPRERLMLKQLMKGCISWEGPQAGLGKECKNEGAAETKCYELTTAHIPCLPVPLGREGDRRI